MKALPILALALLPFPVGAQCPFDPTITPDPAIVCPIGFLTLQTQTYDAYQWYENGSPITGQTFSFLQVDGASVGNAFTVACTLAGCTEVSPPVVLDGWAFLPPVVMTTGTPPLYTDGNGVPHYCPGDTVLLVLMQPYDILIQWTDGGAPIPGATDDTLAVFDDGNFSVSGAPVICPGFVQQLGVTIGITFDPILQPGIIPNGPQLCASPAGFSYEWYWNGTLIPGSNSQCIDATQQGSYVVVVDYGDMCTEPSDPYLVTGITEASQPGSWSVFPLPANDETTIHGPQGASIGAWQLLDLTGRSVLHGVEPSRTLMIPVKDLPEGCYWFRAKNAPVLRLPLSR